MSPVFSYLKPRWFFVSVYSCFVSGCGSSTLDSTDETYTIPVHPPAALQGARLLYQTGEGIFLQQPLTVKPRLIVKGGTWPRWSPDGGSFAYAKDDAVWLYVVQNNKSRLLAKDANPIAIAFHPDGNEVWFSNGKAIHSVKLTGGEITHMIQGVNARELDLAGDKLAITEKNIGYQVVVFTLPGLSRTVIGRGCSAGLSPDGNTVMANRGNHTELALYESLSGRQTGKVISPGGIKLDNQQWSNRPEWIVAVKEGDVSGIAVQRVTDGKFWRLTDMINADRPDLFIP